MKPLSIETIRRVTAARAVTAVPRELAIASINTDTRKGVPGSLFVALAGENFDGHTFVPASAATGAVAALIEKNTADLPADFPVLRVDSTRAALGKIARHVREQFRGTVVAVAGSNGKTSTKHLVHSALIGKLRGSMSPKSFNNDIGVPLAIFDADPQHDFLVLEMGTNHPGEIRTLTQIGRPDIAVITNCGEEHLEFLGDVPGVRRENASIAEGLSTGGVMVVNGDDRELLAELSKFSAKKITFGFEESNDLFATDVRLTDDGVRFNLNGSRQAYFVPQLGRHAASNALAAIAVARRMGLNDTEIAQNLAVATQPEMRLQMQQHGTVKVLNDAYNANPASMRAALQTFAALPAAGRRVAVLGDMRELGETSERYHREIGEAAADAKVDLLVCVGSQSKFLAESARERGILTSQIHHFDDSKSASETIQNLVIEGDTVLVKASRGVKLEVVAKKLEKLFSITSRPDVRAPALSS